MARTLDIPARVAVGFLAADQGRPNDRTSTAPTTCTPGPRCTSAARAGCASSPRRRRARGTVPPKYTIGQVHEAAADPDGRPTKGGKITDRPDREPVDPGPARPDDVEHLLELGPATSRGPGSSVGARWCWSCSRAIALVPGVVRRRASQPASGRWRGGGLGSSCATRAVDLGVGWPGSRSPHETGYLLAGWFGPEPDGARWCGRRAGAVSRRAPRTRSTGSCSPWSGCATPGTPTTFPAPWPRTCAPASPRWSTAARVARCAGRGWFPRSLFGGGRRAAARAELRAGAGGRGGRRRGRPRRLTGSTAARVDGLQEEGTHVLVVVDQLDAVVVGVDAVQVWRRQVLVAGACADQLDVRHDRRVLLLPRDPDLARVGQVAPPVHRSVRVARDQDRWRSTPGRTAGRRAGRVPRRSPSCPSTTRRRRRDPRPASAGGRRQRPGRRARRSGQPSPG